VRDDAAGLLRTRDEGLELALARGVDERLDADVRRRLGVCQELVDGSLRGQIDRLARKNVVRAVLRLLYVRLVEGVDAEDRAGNRGRELPAIEVLPELVRVGHAHFGLLPVVAGRRLARNGDETFALLAGRLGEQLLGPETEAAGIRVDEDLVTTLLPAVTERLPELEARVALAQVARLDHLVDPQEETRQIDVHERGGNQSEDRERGVAAPDRRLPGDDCSEAALAGDPLELGARIGDRDERIAAPDALPEEIELGACLQRGPGLRRRDEERAFEIEAVGDTPDGRWMSCVEHVKPLVLEGATKHLGSEARAAHAE
jgi:hypothetical protein